MQDHFEDKAGNDLNVMEAYTTSTKLNTTSTMKYIYSYDISFDFPEGCIILNFTSEFIPWNNPNNLISSLVTETWERILYGILLPVFFLINLPCNTLNIVIFFKHGIKERINLCLFFLSLVDFLFMVQAFSSFADRIYLEFTQQPLFGALQLFIASNYLWGLWGFSWVSSWITTIIACERCFCVVSPLRSQTVLKTKTMWVIILVPSTVLIGVFFVINAKWGIECVFNPVENFTELTYYPSDFFLRNKNLIDKLDGVMYGLIIPQFCVITVTVATIITVVKLRSMSEWREKSSISTAAMSSRDVSLTRMLVGTSVLYIISFIPRSVLRMITLFIKDLSIGGYFHNTYSLLMDIATLCTFINSSFNFFIYYLFGSKFRTTLKTMFHCKDVKAKKAADNSTVHSPGTVSHAGFT